MSVKSILSGYGLYDDVLGIIDDYAVGTKDDFIPRYKDVLDEMKENDFVLEQIKSYRSYEMFKNLVETILFRSVDGYMTSDYIHEPPEDYWNERSCTPLCDWNISLYENILLDKLQKKVEKFLKVFPHILYNKELSYIECKRLTELFKQPIHRLNFRTYDIQYLVSRLQKRDTKCRLYVDSLKYCSHVDLDKIENFPDLKLQFQLNQCHDELKSNYNQIRKVQLEKKRKLRLEQHKTFYVGWTYTCEIPFTQMKNVTFKITRVTPKCIYYTKTQNGIESDPKRKLIKITGDENGFGGIQYFKETRHFEVMATYIMFQSCLYGCVCERH